MVCSMEVRIWKGSLLVDKRVEYVEEEFGVIVTKVGRGVQASDNKEVILEEADYITFNGGNDNCLKLVKATIPQQQPHD